MTETPRQWVRLYVEWASDPKIQMMPEHMQRRHIMLLCLRGNQETDHMTDKQMAFHMRITAKEAQETRELFEEMGFTNGWGVAKWKKRQGKSDISTTRVKKWRERHKCPECGYTASNVQVKPDGELKYCPYCT